MSLSLNLEGRVALVSGASRGIGAEIARVLSRAGAGVALGVNQNTERAERVAAEIREAGGRALLVPGDLSAPETAGAMTAAAQEEFGHLDILVNNAGIWEESPIDTIGDRFLERMLETNFGGAVRLCREAAPLLAASSYGRIINISSTASLLGEPRYSVYAATKGALDALTRSLAVELGPQGVTVNSVAPGWTRTDMTEDALKSEAGKAIVASIPLRKPASDEDVAYAVAFLASDWAGHINGVTLFVEGGYRLRR